MASFAQWIDGFFIWFSIGVAAMKRQQQSNITVRQAKLTRRLSDTDSKAGTKTGDGEIFEFDIDEDALCGGSASRQSKSSRKWYRCGPTNLEETMLSNHDAAIRLVQVADAGMKEKLVEWVKLDIVATSSFTGTGVAEAAYFQAKHDLASALGIEPGKFLVYSGCDHAMESQHAMMNHGKATSPKHVFPEFLDRLHPMDLKKNQEYLEENLSVVRANKEEYLLGAMTKQQLNSNQAALSARTLETSSKNLGRVEFRTTSWCSVHKRECPISPRQEYPGWHWWESAGTVCCPFSTMADSTPSWCHPSSLGTLSWAFSMRYFEPDDIDHECVRNFPEEVFNGIFAETDGILKSPFLPPSSPYVGYTMRTKVFSPTDLGIPSMRHRKYSRWKLGNEQVPSISFEDLLFRSLDASPDIYFVANAHARCAEWEEFHGDQKSKPVVASNASNMLTDISHLSTAALNKLEGYDTLAKKLGLHNPDAAPGSEWSESCVIVNLKQTAEHVKFVHWDAMPTLLRHSLLFDLVRRNTLTVAEAWLVQGFPHPDVHSLADFAADSFPFIGPMQSADGESNSQRLPIRRQLSLIGNSMHRAAVGHWILYNIL